MRLYIWVIAVFVVLACRPKSFDTALIEDVNPCESGEVLNPQGECDEIADYDLDEDLDLDGDDTGEADADSDGDDTGEADADADGDDTGQADTDGDDTGTD